MEATENASTPGVDIQIAIETRRNPPSLTDDKANGVAGRYKVHGIVVQVKLNMDSAGLVTHTDRADQH